jgi:type VI protein secretion system component VasF
MAAASVEMRDRPVRPSHQPTPRARLRTVFRVPWWLNMYFIIDILYFLIYRLDACEPEVRHGEV